MNLKYYTYYATLNLRIQVFLKGGFNHMTNVIQFTASNVAKYRFIVDIVKERDNPKARNYGQHVVIRLKDSHTGKKSQVHPLTIATDVWSRNKTKTIKDKTQTYVFLLNYVYFDANNPIDNFFNININMLLSFFKQLNPNLNREYVKKIEANISEVLYYFCKRNLLKNIYLTDFATGDKKLVYLIGIKNQYALPERKASNKLHNVKPEIALALIDIALDICPKIALGIYLQIFGGLRASEVVCLECTDVHYNVKKDEFKISVTLSDKDLRPDIKTGFIRKVKKPRKQKILAIEGLFDELYNNNKLLIQHAVSNALFINRDGNPMTVESYSRYFNKVKRILLERMSASSDLNTALYAQALTTENWSTHIGRGIFSNIVANASNTSYELATLRGDKNYSSSLPYLCDTEETERLVTTAIGRIYEEQKHAKENQLTW